MDYIQVDEVRKLLPVISEHLELTGDRIRVALQDGWRLVVDLSFQRTYLVTLAGTFAVKKDTYSHLRYDLVPAKMGKPHIILVREDKNRYDEWAIAVYRILDAYSASVADKFGNTHMLSSEQMNTLMATEPRATRIGYIPGETGKWLNRKIIDEIIDVGVENIQVEALAVFDDILTPSSKKRTQNILLKIVVDCSGVEAVRKMTMEEERHLSIMMK